MSQFVILKNGAGKTLKSNKNIILVFANNMYLPVYSMYVFGEAEVTESVEKAYEDFKTFI